VFRVCVPEVAISEAIEHAARVDVVLWPDGQPAPVSIEDVQLLVPPRRLAAMTTDELALMPRLEVIQLLTAGSDPWLGLAPQTVTLCSGQGIHGSSTAELAVAAVLHQIRDLARYERQQADRRWQPGERHSIAGSNVAVLGAGDIGGRVADVLTILGARVVVVSRTAREGILSPDEFRPLIAEQNVVVVATPLTAQTRGMVGKEFLAALPDQAVVVNVARGPIVDTNALLAELHSGRLSAALHVTDPEPLAGHPLWTAPNLLLTPHVGGGSMGWQQRAGALVQRQIGHLLRAEPLENVVG